MGSVWLTFASPKNVKKWRGGAIFAPPPKSHRYCKHHNGEKFFSSTATLKNFQFSLPSMELGVKFVEKDIFEKIDNLEPSELENYGVIVKANSSEKVNGYPTYICPQCGNGSHGAKSMGLTVKKFGWGYNYWCHRCGNFTATKLLEQKLGSLANVAEWYKTNFFPFNGNLEKFGRKEVAEKSFSAENYAELYRSAKLGLKKFFKKYKS